MVGNQETIGDRIRKLREAKGETQAVVANMLDVKRETVNHWENGTRDLKTEYTIKLAQYFQTTCDYILRGIEAENIDVNRKLGLEHNVIEILVGLQNTKIAYFEPSSAIKVTREQAFHANDILYAINRLIEKEYNCSVLKRISDFIENDYDDIEAINNITGIAESFSGEILSKAILITIQNNLIRLREQIQSEKSGNK